MERERDKKIKEKFWEILKTNVALKGVFPWSVVIPAFLACEMLFLFFVKHSLPSYSF